MDIYISSSIGHGLTELSAFDSALSRLGVGDQNLIHLSSVIPAKSNIVRDKINLNGTHLGQRVYCVYAEKRTNQRGSNVCAGLGWVTSVEKPNWGLFVEHTGHTEEEVSKQIYDSIESMKTYRPEFTWSEVQEEIVVATCETKPVCALAFAFYKIEKW